MYLSNPYMTHGSRSGIGPEMRLVRDPFNGLRRGETRRLPTSSLIKSAKMRTVIAVAYIRQISIKPFCLTFIIPPVNMLTKCENAGSGIELAKLGVNIGVYNLTRAHP